MQRRYALLSAVALLGSGAALALKPGSESVAVYVVPLDDVPEAIPKQG